jgi:hypothetical protein
MDNLPLVTGLSSKLQPPPPEHLQDSARKLQNESVGTLTCCHKGQEAWGSGRSHLLPCFGVGSLERDPPNQLSRAPYQALPRSHLLTGLTKCIFIHAAGLPLARGHL